MIGQSLLKELEIEAATTRRVLERIPSDKLGWKAHPKSNTIGWVGGHLGEIVGWVEGTLTQDSWDIAPEDGEPNAAPDTSTFSAILNTFDQNMASARSLLSAVADEEFSKPWSLLASGQILFTMPKLDVIRVWVLNHTIHHRAYLCCYLRLNDIPVPSVYGPSGDEEG